MRHASGIATLLTVACLVSPAAPAGEGVAVRVSRSRVKEKRRKTHLGLDRVEHHLIMGQAIHLGGLKLSHRIHTDPANDDQPVSRGWAPVVFSCLLGPGYANGQWDRWSFLDVQLRTAGKARNAVRTDWLRGMCTLGQGRRGLADVVWHAAGKSGQNTLALRVMKLPEAPTWAFFEVCPLRQGDELLSIAVGGYPHSTTPDLHKLGRRRWVTTAARQQELAKAHLGLDPQAEHLVILHNKTLQEDAGLVLVFSPREVGKAEVGGTYGVRVRLTPRAGTACLHFGCSYFAQQHYADAARGLLPQAAAHVAKLESLDWSVNVQAKALGESAEKDARDLLGVAAIAAKFGAKYTRARAALDEAQRRIAVRHASVHDQRIAEHEYGAALAACRAVVDDMRREWLRTLPID